ncbi:MAG: divalent-cation tolerance protein CutA [Desulfobacter sp.]|nr:MAG: divalent-cation tolerance protein CutA [Desulfobacter sp.]
MSYCMVLVTCESQAEAHGLAGKLLEKRLAACVQIHPVTSIYTWKNKVHTDPEFRMVIKTTTELYPAIEKFIAGHHGYEVPQIISVPIEQGLPSYLNWMDEHTR